MARNQKPTTDSAGDSVSRSNPVVSAPRNAITPLTLLLLPLALLGFYQLSVIFNWRTVLDLLPSSLHHYHGSVDVIQAPAELNSIPFETRAYWMRRAQHALYEQLDTPCPRLAFGSVIVNHTDTTSLGEEICIGVAEVEQYGNPTLHGEVSNINNCTRVLSRPPFSLSPPEIISAWSSLSLYTTGEPCPMCASAIRWSGFRECIFATSIDSLLRMGWMQIDVRSREIFAKSWTLRNGVTGLLGGVLTNETDEMFNWQFQKSAACPVGCARRDGECEKI